MASIARSFRPVALRLAAIRTVRPAASCRRIPVAGRRFFSASSSLHAKKYTTEHEWIELSTDKKTGTIGISEYAAHALGDVVYVELPTTPLEVAAGDSIGAVESVKSASDINSPITCTITEVNSILEEKPSTINKGPEDDSTSGGWVARVKVAEAGVKDMENLMDEEAYKKFVEE